VAADGGARFVIGVIGDSPVRALLEQRSADSFLHGRPVLVQGVADLAEARSCHMLFIAETAPLNLEEILDVTADFPVLTVSERDGFAERGVLINLYVEGDRVRFEINQAAVRRSGLIFRSKLYKVARLIDTEGTP